jgi:hypothetical protein
LLKVYFSCEQATEAPSRAFGADGLFPGDRDTPRIPKAEIDQLKRRIPPAKLAEAHGVRLRRHGADLLGRCPPHADRTRTRRRRW